MILQNGTSWPTPLVEAAFHGPAGEIVRMIEPHTEADPAAILGQLLAGIGNIVGPGPHFMNEATKHRLNLFLAVVGRTSDARKGTSWGYVPRVLGMIDEGWTSKRIQGGLATGEGLVAAVAENIPDKRLLVLESEFAKVLGNMNRQGNNLSEVIRQSWETGDLNVMNKNSPVHTRGAHISIVGHITPGDLRDRLDPVDVANGFGNRFLWMLARRSKILPEGGQLAEADWRRIGDMLRDPIAWGKTAGEFVYDDAARAVWAEAYVGLTEGQDGPYGEIVARGAPQVRRLACIFALLDQSATVNPVHLEAALAVWDYCDESAQVIFAGKRRDPVADRIMELLRRRGHSGATRTEIRDFLGRNVPADKTDAVLKAQREAGLARAVTEQTGGRPAERWFACNLDERIEATGAEAEEELLV